jgi:hypothetical protein
MGQLCLICCIQNYLAGLLSGLYAVVVEVRIIRGDGYVALTDVEAISLGIGTYVISFSVRRLGQVVCMDTVSC